MAFQLQAPYTPQGDQPTAIHALVKGVDGGKRYQTLLGATGTGKTCLDGNNFDKKYLQEINFPLRIVCIFLSLF